MRVKLEKESRLVGLCKRHTTRRSAAAGLMASALIPLGLYAASGQNEYGLWTFQPGDIIKASDVNENFDILGEHMVTYEDAITVDGDGNVGIGAINPQRALHVHGSTDGYGYVQITDGVTGPAATDGMRIGFNSEALRVQNFEPSDMSFLTNDSGSVLEALTIKAAGNVGIGTTTPGNRLTVEGAGEFRGGGNSYIPGTALVHTYGLRLEQDNAVNAIAAVGLNLAINRDTAAAAIRNNSGPALVVEKGNVGIGTTNPELALDLGDSGDIHLGEGRSIQWGDRSSNPAVLWGYSDGGGSKRVLIDGNVGIGTSSPRSTLEVAGYVQLALSSGTPPSTDCDEEGELGRMKVDPDEGLYVCMNSGWMLK